VSGCQRTIRDGGGAERLELKGFRKIERTTLDVVGSAQNAWDRNRTGTGSPPRDFLTHYSFRCCGSAGGEPRPTTLRIWGLDFTFALSHTERELGRGRQVSTLSARSRARLSSVLQAPEAGAAVPPTLTPFTPAVSERGAQCLKSLASTNFATQATRGAFYSGPHSFGPRLTPRGKAIVSARARWLTNAATGGTFDKNQWPDAIGRRCRGWR
jgi:hypothetical protein